MKKRLLITSIVMMLVVAVALSTATYAWFTSNANVTANTVTLTAASSDGVALGISWGTSGTIGTEISAYGGATLKPLMPATLGENSTLADVAFTGGSTYSNSGVLTFNDPIYSGENAYYYKQAAEGEDVIRLTNLSVAGGRPIASVTITPTITPNYIATTENELAAEGYTYYNGSKVALQTQPTVGQAIGTAGYKVLTGKDASSLVRIAIFYSATNAANSYKLLKVLGNAADLNTVYGTAEADKAVGTGDETDSAKENVCIQGKYPTVATCTLPVTEGVAIAPNSSVYVKIVMWLDGQAFTDAYANYTSDVNITFAAA